MELIPGLHWIEGRSSNIFLWEDESGLLLVDTGMPGDDKALFSYLTQIGRQPSDIIAILITHADMDHAGNAAVIQAKTQATIYCGEQTAALLCDGKSPKHMPRPVQFIIDRFMHYKPVPTSVIQVVNNGDAVAETGEWRALSTPGHTPDHYSFWCGQHGVLFTGDALNTRRDKLNLSEKRITADLEAARQSAIRLLQLHPVVIACGHGRPMRTHDAGDIMALFHAIKNRTTA